MKQEIEINRNKEESMSAEKNADIHADSKGSPEASSQDEKIDNTAQQLNGDDINNYSEEEKNEAYRRGWRPLEEFKGDKSKYVTPREYLLRGELGDVRRELRANQKALEELLTRQQKRDQLYNEKTIEELQAKRREAIQNGDIQTVEALDKQVDSIKEIKYKEEQSQARSSELHPDVKSWVERHRDTWFNPSKPENIEMMEEAEKIERRVDKYNPSLSMSERLQIVEEEIRRKYPHRFGNPNRSRAAAVEGASESDKGSSRKSYDPSKITPELKAVAHAFVRRGVFKNVDDYYKAYYGV